jgi:hypothetical protein
LGPLFFFEASWAVVVPTDTVQRSLERDVRVYAWANFGLGIFVMVYLLAHVVGAYIFGLAACSVPLIIYSVFMKRRVRDLTRIPTSESVLLLARRVGREKLWQQVYLGFFGFASYVFFFFGAIIKKHPLPFGESWLGWILVAWFLANSILALRGFRMLPKDREQK